MDGADIEALVLSGELFNGPKRSSSPRRSPSPDNDPGWHDDELQKAKEEDGGGRDLTLDYDSDDYRRDALKARIAKENQKESIGMGPGRTGVKGVIRDRNEAQDIQRQKKADEAEELRLKMEASSLGGKTYLEEEREKAARGEKADDLVMKEVEKNSASRMDVWGRSRGRFGHLREVGMRGFVDAVEKEERGIWVVVHLYDSSLERCYLLDERLSRLAKGYPNTKFLRAKASALGFTSGGSRKSAPASRVSKPMRAIDEDDPYGSDEAEDESESVVDDDDIDLDMLPTMLVYRDGELVHNWVRVDWELKDFDVESLLEKYHILPRHNTHPNLGLPSDDEDDDDFDILYSDDDI